MFPKSKSTPNSAGASTPERRQAQIARRRRFWRKASKSFLWLLTLLFVAHLSLNIYASVQLNRELSAIRQRGEPMRLSDLEPPAVPDAQNAALVYQQATKSLHFSPEEKVALGAPQSKLSPQQKLDIESALRDNQKALSLIRQAAAIPDCRFPINWKGDPTRLRFPYYAELRELARFLAADARLKATRGEKEAAFGDVRALFGMSHHLSKEPFLIGFLVAQAVDSIAYRALAQTLENIPVSPAQARALEASFPKSDWVTAFRRSLLGERTFSLFAFEGLGQKQQDTNNSEEDTSYMPVWTSYPLLWIARPVLKLDEVQTLRLWKFLLYSPESQQIPQSATYSQTLETTIQRAPFYAVLTKILFPVFSRAGVQRDRAEVRRRQSTVAMALTCYHTEKGHYPSNLGEAEALWGQTLPLDLYGSKSFVYKSDGKTFTLYSIGPNRTDDGGKNPYLPPPNRSPSADDIVWSSS